MVLETLCATLELTRNMQNKILTIWNLYKKLAKEKKEQFVSVRVQYIITLFSVHQKLQSSKKNVQN